MLTRFYEKLKEGETKIKCETVSVKKKTPTNWNIRKMVEEYGKEKKLHIKRSTLALR